MGANKFYERMTSNIKARHMTNARQLAERIQEQAALCIARLDAGELPQRYSLIEDVHDLSRRVEALETLRELTEIYQTTDEG